MANYYGQISSGVRGRQADMMALERERMKMQQERAAQEQAAKLAQTRQNILQQYFAPAQDELQAMGGNSLQSMMDKIDQGQMPQGDIQTQIVQREARFDPRGAMGALFGAGDFEAATQMGDVLDAEQKARQKDMNRWSGAVTYIEDPENPGVTIAVQPSTQGEGEPFRRIGVAAMTPEAKARQQSAKDKMAMDRAGMDLDRQKFLFDQKKFYEGPEIEARKSAIEEAGKQGRSANATLAILNQVEPYLDQASSSDLERLARSGASFVGIDSPQASADRVINQAAASLTLSAPKLGGAASDRDVALYAEAMGALKTGTIQQKRDAIRFIRDKLNQYGAESGAPSSVGRPAPAASAMPKMPPASQHKGRIVRDTASGVRYQSDGSKWVRVK